MTVSGLAAQQCAVFSGIETRLLHHTYYYRSLYYQVLEQVKTSPDNVRALQLI